MPESGRTVTTVPWSKFRAICRVATRAAPAETPSSTPSSRATDGDNLIDNGGVVDFGHRAGRQVLQPFEPMKGPIWLNGNHPRGRHKLAQVASNACDRTCRAHAGHEVRDHALRLLHDLGPRALVMRPPIGGVAVLVRVVETRRFPPGQLCRDFPRAIGALQRVGERQFGAQRPQDLQALRTGVGGDRQVDPNAQGCAQRGVGDSHIAGGGIEEHSPFLQEAFGKRPLQNRSSRTVLNRSAGVVALGLSVDVHVS